MKQKCGPGQGPGLSQYPPGQQGGQGQGGTEGEEDGRGLKVILNPGGEWTPITALQTVLMVLELRERSSSTQFFLFYLNSK